MANRETLPTERLIFRAAKVFYTIFANNKVVTPIHTASLDKEGDRDIGCILAARIPPPCTVSSLKAMICDSEQITDPTSYKVYGSADDEEPLDENQKLNIKAGRFPGLEQDEPIVLVKKKCTDVGVDSDSSPSQYTYIKEKRLSLKTFPDLPSPIQHAVISTDGSFIASISVDLVIRVFRVASGTLVNSFEAECPTSQVNHVTFSQNGNQIASIFSHGTTQVWDTISGECLLVLKRDRSDRKWVIRSNIAMVAFSPCGKRLASGLANGVVKIHDLVSGECVETPNGDLNSVSSLSFCPDGARLVSGSEFGHLQLWDVASMTLIAKFPQQRGHSCSVAWSADGSLVASGYHDKTIKVWDVLSRSLVATFGDHSGPVTSIAFYPDGMRIASASAPCRVMKIWDLTSGTDTTLFQGHTATIHSVAFFQDGLISVPCSDGKTLRLWRVAYPYDL